jgi:hypothetical protein
LPIDFDPKKCPTHLLTWRGRWGKNLETTINEDITTKKLTKKNPTHPLLEKMGWNNEL